MTAISCHRFLALLCLAAASAGCGATETRPREVSDGAPASTPPAPQLAAGPTVPTAAAEACAPADPTAANGLAATVFATTVRLDPNTASEEILVGFEIELAAGQSDPIAVWDSKYSAGYRSWWFEVRSPAQLSNSQILRREVQDEWDKNAPHPVLIAAGQPYRLEGWGAVHGMTRGNQYFFSLAKLGLDTRVPGDYTIIGGFEQAGGAPPPQTGPACMWGGRVVSAPVTVTVR